MDDIGLLSTRVKIIAAAALFAVVITIVCFLAFYRYYRRKGSEIADSLERERDELLYPEVAYFSEIGKRESQQDAFYISPMENYRRNGIVLLVTDGMGGLKYGDEISSEIAESIENMYPLSFHAAEMISDELRRMSNSIYEKYRLQGGATLAMVHISGNYMNFYSSGDSDIILIRGGEATRLNPRQNYLSTLVGKLSKSGRTTYEAYVDKKSRALIDFMGNSNPKIIYTTRPIRLTDDDVVVICSDGVTDAVPCKSMVQFSDGSAKRCAQQIKRSIIMKKHPRQDNYTGIVIKLSRGIIN